MTLCTRPHPSLPIIGSEDCNAESDRGVEVNASEAFLGLEDNLYAMASECWSAVANRSFVAGQFTWTGFDYRGEEPPTVWPSTNSHFGFLDLAGFAKDRAFWWKAQYKPETPLAHLAIVANHTANTVGAFVYTSGDAAELYVDGATWVRARPSGSSGGHSFRTCSCPRG